MRPPLIKPSQRHQIRQREKPAPQLLGDRITNLVALLLKLVSALGLILTFSGFGVALALASTFNTDLLEVLHGPGDFLAASAYVLLQLVVKVDVFLKSEQFVGVLWSVVAPLLASCAALFWFLFALCSDPRLPQLKVVEKTRDAAIKIDERLGSRKYFRGTCRHLALVCVLSQTGAHSELSV
jgi:hypothetical protein